MEPSTNFACVCAYKHSSYPGLLPRPSLPPKTALKTVVTVMKLSSSERCRLPAGVCGLTCGTVLHQMLSQKNEKYGYMYRAHNEQLMALL